MLLLGSNLSDLLGIVHFDHGDPYCIKSDLGKCVLIYCEAGAPCQEAGVQ
jgi:hypothetical protein